MTAADYSYVVDRVPVAVVGDAELGDEFLLRVRVVALREETIDIRRLGDPEPRVTGGRRDVDLLLLDRLFAGSRSTLG